MTLIKDLIDIPDRVYKDQYVLRLSEGVTRPDETLSDYVVTPELTTCFNAALSMIRSAVTNRTSKAAFLHGSFGTGESHFMAVLHLVLQGNPVARGIIELAPVVQKHNDWLADKESADFLKGDYWRLRGKLDVPKERWVSFPHCEGPGRHARRRLGRLRPPPARPGHQRLLRRRPGTSRRPRRHPPRPRFWPA